MKVRFRLVGAPPGEAVKEIEVNPEMTVGEIKKIIRKKFNLPTTFELNLIDSFPNKKDNDF